VDRVKWRKPINRLMAIFVVFVIVSFIPDIADPVKLLLLPAVVGLGYFIEWGFMHNHLQAGQSIVSLRSLLFPVGTTIFLLITGGWDNRPILEVITEPMFWVSFSVYLTLWLFGSSVYRYLHLGFTSVSVD
jgi:hypothetical protein